MTEATRSLLVDVATSILLLAAFLILAATVAALALAWRGVRAARRELGPGLRRMEAVIAEMESTTVHTAEGVVGPPIRVASTWAGVRAAARTLFGGATDPAPTDGPPPL